MKQLKQWIKEMFSDSEGFLSSRRGLGALCLVFSMIMFLIIFFISDTKDISGNMLTLLLALITAGTALLGIGVLEKHPPK